VSPDVVFVTAPVEATDFVGDEVNVVGLPAAVEVDTASVMQVVVAYTEVVTFPIGQLVTSTGQEVTVKVSVVSIVMVFVFLAL
jgi:hypothetical protein